MDPPELTAALAVRNAHAWFEHNSGWAPPDDDTLAEWLAGRGCPRPDPCPVAPPGPRAGGERARPPAAGAARATPPRARRGAPPLGLDLEGDTPVRGPVAV